MSYSFADLNCYVSLKTELGVTERSLIRFQKHKVTRSRATGCDANLHLFIDSGLLSAVTSPRD